MPHTILVVDDHVMVRQGLRTLLEQAGYVVTEEESGEAAYLAWRQHQPDLVLLDIDMPGSGGLETLKRIIAQHKSARIVIYSMYADTAHVTRAMQAGACGYIAKSDAPELLLEAIRMVLKGRLFIGHDMAARIAMQKYSRLDNPVEALSPREFEIFRRLVAGETLNEIAQHLHISTRSAANFQTRIRQKLNVQTTTEMSRIASTLEIPAGD